MPGGDTAQAFGLGLQRRILHHGEASAERVAHPPRALLQHVGKLMAEQHLAVEGVGIIVPRREVNVRSHGEGLGPDRSGLRAEMDTHVGEVGPEGRFHLAKHGLRQRPATGAGLDQPGRQGAGMALRAQLRNAGPHHPQSRRETALDNAGASVHDFLPRTKMRVRALEKSG
jgi:hypothetical protein